MLKSLTINGEQFPYENAQYSDTDRRITGRHFVQVLTPDISSNMVAKFQQYGVIDIRDMAINRVLEKNPDYQELTSFGTYKKGFWKHVRTEESKVLFWVMNKQPASMTFVANKIDGIGSEFIPNSLYSKIQLNMQNGVTSQIVMPETGYSCIIEPVCNKKQMDIFTKHFICEKYIEMYEAGKLMDVEVIAHIKDVYAKYDRLEDYRQEVQRNIWSMVNFHLKNEGYIAEWKKENLYTLPTRMAFAVDKQTEEILHKYNKDFGIPAANQLTLNDLKNKDNYNEMIRIIQEYGPKFGVSVKTTEQQATPDTYMPHAWMRDEKGTITDTVLLKQALRIQQGLKAAPLNELLQAYIQIDWYMNQPDMYSYLVDGYHICSDACDYIVSKHDKVCPKCGALNPHYEPDSISYDQYQYMIDRDEQ